MQQADPTYLLEKTGIMFPPIGFYDVPDSAAFEPVMETRACVFAYFKEWQKGRSLLLSKEHYGCPGAGKWLCSIQTQVYSKPGDRPVIAPFGSGCMQLVSLFENLDEPQAIIGATDMAMRKYLPYDILAFTVTRKMFERLCALDRNSYLEKRFLSDLMKNRKKDMV